MKRLMVWVFGALLAVGIVTEVGLRLAGAMDFPLYEVGPQIGYIPAPNQRGSYLNKNRWMVNERSLDTTAWRPNGTRDLLLLGDSIVWGGNHYDHEHKLGPQLEEALRDKRHPFKVWPASAASWGILNEIAYLELYPDITSEADLIVWVVNSEDFGHRAVWQTDTTHPRQRPWSASIYLLSKFLVPKILPRSGSTPVPTVTSVDTLARLRESLRLLSEQSPARPILFVFFPSRRELQHPSQPSVIEEALRENTSGRVLIAVRADPRWHAELYKEDGIHPSAEGYKVLSGIIADGINTVLASGTN